MGITYSNLHQIIPFIIEFFWFTAVAAESHIQKPLTGIPISVRGLQITSNFPDPCIVYNPETKTLYAFATTDIRTYNFLLGLHTNIQIASVQNGTTWNIHREEDALPSSHLSSWQTGRRVWAPDVKRLPSGRWLLYYSDALRSSPAFHCIGAASSDNITGPYEALPEPLICPHGGAIDPQSFSDEASGKRYIIYKIDSNSLGNGGSCNNNIPPIQPTPIMIQEVDPGNGFTLVGEPTKILDRDALDGPLVESPAMYRSHEGVYFLFFSSNCFSTPLYDISFATAMSIRGPFRKAARPLLITGDFGLIGPGGLDILDLAEWEGIQAKAQAMVAFHGHMPHEKGKPLIRGMFTGIVHFEGHEATFDGY